MVNALSIGTKIISKNRYEGFIRFNQKVRLGSTQRFRDFEFVIEGDGSAGLIMMETLDQQIPRLVRDALLTIKDLRRRDHESRKSSSAELENTNEPVSERYESFELHS